MPTREPAEHTRGLTPQRCCTHANETAKSELLYTVIPGLWTVECGYLGRDLGLRSSAISSDLERPRARPAAMCTAVVRTTAVTSTGGAAVFLSTICQLTICVTKTVDKNRAPGPTSRSRDPARSSGSAIQRDPARFRTISRDPSRLFSAILRISTPA